MGGLLIQDTFEPYYAGRKPFLPAEAASGRGASLPRHDTAGQERTDQQSTPAPEPRKAA